MKRINKAWEYFGAGMLVVVLLSCLMALGPVDKILIRQAKGVPVTVHNAISATVTAANTTPIDMTTFTKGCLQLVLISGTTGISVQPYVCDTATGTYVIPNTMLPGGVTGGSTWTAYPACAITTASKTFMLEGLHGKYVKFVPTVTGATSGTVKFTPSS